jgi:hypothetical protein
VLLELSAVPVALVLLPESPHPTIANAINVIANVFIAEPFVPRDRGAFGPESTTKIEEKRVRAYPIAAPVRALRAKVGLGSRR